MNFNLTIHKDIRRNYLYKYFEERPRCAFHEIFASNDDKREFLQKCAQLLKGQPQAEWTTIIARMRNALNSYEGDFEQWFQKYVVSRLCMLLKVELPCRLTNQVLQLLIQMLKLALDATAVARAIMEYQLVHRVIALAQCPRRAFEDRLRCTALLSRLAKDPNLREQIVRNGAGDVLVEQVRQVMESIDKLNNDSVILLVEASSNFLGMLRPNGFFPPHMQLASRLLRPFMQLLMMEEVDDRALVQLILCLIRILTTSREHILVSVYGTLGFPQRLFSLILSNQLSVRTQAVCLLANMTSIDCLNITDDLLARGITSQMWECVCRFPASSVFLTKNVILALNNLIVSENSCETICASPICAYVINQLTASEMVELQMDAAYFINTALQQLRYISLEAFLARHDIIRLLAQCLINLRRQFDKCIFKEVLEALRLIVNRSMDIYHIGPYNPIIHTMKRYNISEIVDKLSETNRWATLRGAVFSLLKSIREAKVDVDA